MKSEFKAEKNFSIQVFFLLAGEFAWDSALRALEVTWASLPPATADTCLTLWEERSVIDGLVVIEGQITSLKDVANVVLRFSPVVTPTSSLELAKPCETPYGKVDLCFVS